ncbi:5487_t:CDS:2 [Funneliformis mosseae]|uniref:5487_t:CDS:1 n=1 Tax=Funneliformis mosseae TaxID=27381 RepID=A0A9N9GXH3_FUNMO|nr:5487_t:CDS:2 [Funneliformis mosseae]
MSPLRFSLVEQKRELCEINEKELTISNVDLAQKYNIRKSTITDILNEKDHWLAILRDQRKIKKFRSLKWPQLKDVLSL